MDVVVIAPSDMLHEVQLRSEGVRRDVPAPAFVVQRVSVRDGVVTSMRTAARSKAEAAAACSAAVQWHCSRVFCHADVLAEIALPPECAVEKIQDVSEVDRALAFALSAATDHVDPAARDIAAAVLGASAELHAAEGLIVIKVKLPASANETATFTSMSILRATCSAECRFMFDLLKSKGWEENIAVMPHIVTPGDASQYIVGRPHVQYQEHGAGVWAVRHWEARSFDWGSRPTPVGTTGLILRPEFSGVLDLGFAYLPDSCGRGLATSCAVDVVAYAKILLGQERIAAVTRAANTRARRLLERVGFPAEPTRESVQWGAEQAWYDIPIPSLTTTVQQ